jgi:hypothetical protein
LMLCQPLYYLTKRESRETHCLVGGQAHLSSQAIYPYPFSSKFFLCFHRRKRSSPSVRPSKKKYRTDFLSTHFSQPPPTPPPTLSLLQTRHSSHPHRANDTTSSATPILLSHSPGTSRCCSCHLMRLLRLWAATTAAI